jgi:hypothetical protein
MNSDPSFWSSAIGLLFVIANAGRLLAYLPQIVAAARCESGAKSVSILTWSYFAFAHLTALLYAIFVLHDPRSVWIFSGNLVVTLILVAIVFRKRRHYLRAASAKTRSTQKPVPPDARPRFSGGSRLAVTNIDGTTAGSRTVRGRRQIVLRFGLQTVTLRAAR